MESSERREPAPVKERRVGTFTFGVVLVLAGLAMTAALFFPQLHWELAVKLSPLVLISLGVEVLLSARKSGKIKYDWLGMLLCLLVVLLALCAFCAAWAMIRYPNEFCW